MENKKRCQFCQRGFIPYRSNVKFCKAKCRYAYAHAKDKRDHASKEKEHAITGLREKLVQMKRDLELYLEHKTKKDKEEDRITDLKSKADKTKIVLDKLSDEQLFEYLVKKRKLPYTQGLYKDDFLVKDAVLRTFTPNQKQVLLQEYKVDLRNTMASIDRQYKAIPLSFEVITGDYKKKKFEQDIDALKEQITTLKQVKIKLELPEPPLELIEKANVGKISRKDKQARIEAMVQSKNTEQMDGSQIRNMEFNTYTLDGQLGQFLGELDDNMVAIALTGDAGAGKSYFSFQLAKLFVDSGRSVKYYTLEEGIGKLTQNKLDQYNLGGEIVMTAHASLEMIDKESEQYNVIIIDSYSKVSKDPEDYEILRQTHPKTIFIVIFQKTTSNTIRGGSSIVFNSSIVIDIRVEEREYEKERIATMKKSRYGTSKWEYSITRDFIIKRD